MSDAFELLNRHFDVSRETFNKLSLYHNLLLKWQPQINLVGPNTIADSWQRHFLDSAQLLKYIDDKTQSIADIGSGAGFPGLVLATCGATNVHLIESDTRKITFLREVSRITQTNVTIHHQRSEKGIDTPIRIIVSRACSELDHLLELSSPYVSHETICLFHKGKNYSTELEGATKRWMFDHNILPSVTDPQGVILKLSNIRKRDYDSSKKGHRT